MKLNWVPVYAKEKGEGLISFESPWDDAGPGLHVLGPHSAVWQEAALSICTFGI